MTGRPRGQAAAAEIVDLYRILFTSDRPLSFDEISEQLSSSYRSNAYVQFRENLEAQNIPVKVDKWTQDEKHTAWVWWVNRLVTTCLTHKRITCKARDGTSGSGKHRDKLLFTANRDKPPAVMERVTEERLTIWTPFIGATGRRHAAGMQFLQGVGPVLAGSKLEPKVRALLEQAQEALRETS